MSFTGFRQNDNSESNIAWICDDRDVTQKEFIPRIRFRVCGFLFGYFAAVQARNHVGNMYLHSGGIREET